MGINDETMGRSVDRPQFDTTHWSLVLAAQDENSAAARIALTKLCEKYWYPLYAFVRQTEADANQACDIIQGFFEKVIEKDYIGDADPKRGKFRTFLLTSLTHFMANQRDKAKALKRGGGVSHFSFEFHKGEQRFLQEPSDPQTPEKHYQQRWAVTLLNQVLEGIRAEFIADDKGPWFEQLSQFLTPGDSESYQQVAERLEMTEGAAKVAVHRLRVRYRERLRAEIAQTVADPGEVDGEIRMLFETFSK
jgi:RNA polymerase sigma-70 factor (ECF subfamily)